MCNRGGGEKEHLNALIKTRPQLCLEVAELQALNQQPMHMRNWIERLDDFLKTGKDILNHAGEISQSMAIEKAEKEHEIFRERTKNELSRVGKDFIEHLETSTVKLANKNTE